VTDYAMIRYENNTVRRIVKNKKPHPNALPIEYPVLLNTLTHDIKLTDCSQWEVLEDKVIAKYDIQKKDFEKEKREVLTTIKSKLKQIYNHTYINYKGSDIIIDHKCVQRLLLKKTVLELDKTKEITWKFNNDFLKLNYNDIIKILVMVDDKLNNYYDKYSELINDINDLKNDDFEKLQIIQNQYLNLR